MSDRVVIIGAYRRIIENAEKGIGCRLTAEEVATIAYLDTAISGAVDAEDEAQAARQEADHGQD